MSYSPDDNYPTTSNSTHSSDHTNYHLDEATTYKIEAPNSSSSSTLPKRRKQRISNNAMDEATLIALRPFKCDECGKRLEKARTLRLHKLSVHQGHRPFTCDICKACFTQNGHLKQHIQTVHKGLRPYGCDLCKRRFTKARSLKLHNCGKNGLAKPFVCDVCGRGFSHMHTMKAHRASIHEELLVYNINQFDFY
ncbi:unnamed protein product [Schistosoma turkestanicum]|nr:unnamed protein product [Schistosoma turkestanicum]